MKQKATQISEMLSKNKSLLQTSLSSFQGWGREWVTVNGVFSLICSLAQRKKTWASSSGFWFVPSLGSVFHSSSQSVSNFHSEHILSFFVEFYAQHHRVTVTFWFEFVPWIPIFNWFLVTRPTRRSVGLCFMELIFSYFIVFNWIESVLEINSTCELHNSM